MYVGIGVFLEAEIFTYEVASYFGITLIALAVSRACNIWPLCGLVNIQRARKGRKITQSQQFTMWWVGLRGPMAFALSLDASDRYGVDGRVMKTTTILVILATVLVNGGCCAFILKTLKLRQCDELPNTEKDPPSDGATVSIKQDEETGTAQYQDPAATVSASQVAASLNIEEGSKDQKAAKKEPWVFRKIEKMDKIIRPVLVGSTLAVQGEEEREEREA